MPTAYDNCSKRSSVTLDWYLLHSLVPVLNHIAWNVESDRLGVESVFDAVSLIFVKLTIGVGRVALTLKSDNHEADKDVDHEESDDDNVDNVKDGHFRPIVQDWAVAFFVRVDACVQDSNTTR